MLQIYSVSTALHRYIYEIIIFMCCFWVFHSTGDLNNLHESFLASLGTETLISISWLWAYKK